MKKFRSKKDYLRECVLKICERMLLQFLPAEKKEKGSKTDVYRVIEDQIDLSMVSYGMRVRWSMHPSSVQFRIVDLQRNKNNQKNKKNKRAITIKFLYLLSLQ